MVDYSALNQAIDDSGMKRSAVAERLAVTPQTLNNKLNGTTELTISEVQKLCEILGFTKRRRQQIFFC